VASELQLGESCHACPFIWDAVQSYMPVVIALLSCYIQLLQLHAKYDSQGRECVSCKAATAFVCMSHVHPWLLQLQSQVCLHCYSNCCLMVTWSASICQSAIGSVSTIYLQPPSPTNSSLCCCVDLPLPAFEHSMVTSV